MITALKIFNHQVSHFRPLGLIAKPYKYFFRWRKSLIGGRNSIQDELPWITFASIDYISKHLREDSKVFEFGGGGSTLFFLKNKASVYTVEHDEKWFEVLQGIVQQKPEAKWKGFFIQAEQGNFLPNPSPSDPSHYSTNDQFYKGTHFKNYSTKILDFEDGFFDMVLVDGRSRPACLYHALSKIKKGGLLILDNSDREYYLTALENEIDRAFTKMVFEYAPSPYSREFTQTTIWVKR